MTSDGPEAREGSREAELSWIGDEVVEGGSEVVVVSLQVAEPGGLVASLAELAVGSLGQGEVVLGVTLAHVPPAGRRQAGPGEPAARGEHPEAAALPADQRVGGQVLDTKARVIAAAPGLARRAQLRRRGLPLAVRVVEAGSNVRATLALGRKTVARRAIRGAKAGTLGLRLKASKAGARRLSRLRRAARATLKVVVAEPGGRSVTATKKVTIRP